MNERIKELAEQAENHAYRVAAAGDDCQEAYTQKFAELIVKECAHYLKTTDYNDALVSNNAALEFAAEDLLELFGVK